MSTTVAAVKPGRKFPPPCWTRDEALVLIEAYRERWYALHRAFLKNPDWDAVAEKVTTSCPDVTPPKTSAQCRHKMEKLRQRHRSEKLRASSFPAGAFFSSWFYFEAMEAMENNQNYSNNSEIGNGIPLLDHRSLNPGRGIRFKPPPVHNLVTLAATPPNFTPNFTPNFDSRVTNHSSSYINNWSNQHDDNEDEYHNHSPYTGARKFSKVVNNNNNNNNNNNKRDENGEMWVKVPRNNIKGKKRGDGIGGVHEVVASIKLLGEGFMKMEKMKIDMAREIERMRMEAEMKRNVLILESQKQIVDAFVKGLIETRKQPRTETMTDS